MNVKGVNNAEKLHMFNESTVNYQYICVDGGKQPLQRAGFYRNGPLKYIHHMVYEVIFWGSHSFILVSILFRMDPSEGWQRAQLSARDLGLRRSKVGLLICHL